MRHINQINSSEGILMLNNVQQFDPSLDQKDLQSFTSLPSISLQMLCHSSDFVNIPSHSTQVDNHPQSVKKISSSSTLMMDGKHKHISKD